MKTAILVPDAVFRAGEHLAEQLRMSRSQPYADALSAYLSARGADAVTANLNTIYSSESSKLAPEFTRSQRARLSNETW